jgi:hypothetical protein
VLPNLAFRICFFLRIRVPGSVVYGSSPNAVVMPKVQQAVRQHVCLCRVKVGGADIFKATSEYGTGLKGTV